MRWKVAGLGEMASSPFYDPAQAVRRSKPGSGQTFHPAHRFQRTRFSSGQPPRWRFRPQRAGETIPPRY